MATEPEDAGHETATDLSSDAFRRLAAVESVKSRTESREALATEPFRRTCDLVNTLLGSMKIGIRGILYTQGFERNLRADVGNPALTAGRFIDDLPEVMRQVIGSLQNDLREYDNVLRTSPLRSKETAEKVTRRLQVERLKNRSENDATALISDVAGLDEISVTQLESAVNVAAVLRHAIAAHEKLAIEEATTLGAGFQRAMRNGLPVEVGDLGTLSKQEYSVEGRKGILRTVALGVDMLRVPVLWLLQDGSTVAEQRSRIRTRHERRIPLGCGLTVNGRALAAYPRPRAARGPMPKVLGTDALNFLRNWDRALTTLESQMATADARAKGQIDGMQAVGVGPNSGLAGLR